MSHLFLPLDFKLDHFSFPLDAARLNRIESSGPNTLDPERRGTGLISVTLFSLKNPQGLGKIIETVKSQTNPMCMGEDFFKRLDGHVILRSFAVE